MVGHALNPLGLLFGPGQGRQQHRREYRNNRDHHEQLNQGKPIARAPNGLGVAFPIFTHNSLMVETRS